MEKKLEQKNTTGGGGRAGGFRLHSMWLTYLMMGSQIPSVWMVECVWFSIGVQFLSGVWFLNGGQNGCHFNSVFKQSGSYETRTWLVQCFIKNKWFRLTANLLKMAALLFVPFLNGPDLKKLNLQFFNFKWRLVFRVWISSPHCKRSLISVSDTKTQITLALSQK